MYDDWMRHAHRVAGRDRDVLKVPGAVRVGVFARSLPLLLTVFVLHAAPFKAAGVALAFFNLVAAVVITWRGGTQLTVVGVRPWGWLFKVVPWTQVESVGSAPRSTRDGQVYLRRRGRKRIIRLRWTTFADLGRVERALARGSNGGVASEVR